MARFWANGPSQASKDEIEAISAEMRKFGASDEQVNEEIEELTRSSETFELLEENVEVWLWFSEVDDCFKWSEGVCLGLDIVAVKAEAEMSEREFTKNDFQGLRIVGKEATAEMNARLTRNK